MLARLFQLFTKQIFLGLSAPVPRGRKGKKIKKETKTVDQIIEESEWTKEEISNPDCLLNDEIYKRHLNRHSNK